MDYFVTGATGFIGRHLVPHLLERGGRVHVLVRESSVDKLDGFRAKWGASEDQVVAVVGDLTRGRLGVSDETVASLRGVDHFFHLAAVYDLTASASEQHDANIGGTRHALELAGAIGAGTFHHVSSIAAAGLFKGLFREDMFAEAENLDTNPYFRTKHDSEGLVRNECPVPFRIYRPAIVVGSSRTGEMDKIDGPYYFFKLIQKIRNRFPKWMPMVGIEGAPINLVPVDFVAAAMDHIAHKPGLDGQAFHLTDPDPQTVGSVMNTFAKAAHAPTFSVRLDPRMAGFIPKGVRKTIGTLPPVKRIASNALNSAQVPKEVLTYIDYPTTFDTRDTKDALADSNISVPPLESYAWKLWDHWERHLDPDLFRDRTLGGAVRGKIVLITGASSGIGKDTARKVGEAGGIVLLVARTPEKLADTKAEIEALGGTAHVHRCDLSDMDDIDRMAEEVLAQHGHVDVIVNNAGRSIRRSIALSYDRFHDFERTMQLNYFGTVRLLLKLLPSMTARKQGHIINISSIGVQTNMPRFSAYVASKAAVDAFSRCIASEVIDDNIHITTVHMPLVRTPMIAPTKIYDAFPTKSPDEASEMIVGAMISKPKRVASRLGTFGQLLYAVSPKTVDAVMNQGYKLFPDSLAAQGDKDGAPTEPSGEAMAFAYVMQGVHW